MVDFVRRWAEATEIAGVRFVRWLSMSRSKFHTWTERYGRANEHNALVPRDHWLEAWEKERIVEFYGRYPLEGYRRLAFMMIDADVVAVSPSSVYRVLRAAGLVEPWNRKASKKGTGFCQPLMAHEHWHLSVAYINVSGTFFYLCTVLDGYSRSIVAWDIRPAMTEGDVEMVLKQARERFPEARPRVISDNGPQFIARDFKEFIREAGMTHVRTSPYYPQSNGKIERYHRSGKSEAIHTSLPGSVEEARRRVDRYVRHYNEVRLHAAIGYVTPRGMLAGRAPLDPGSKRPEVRRGERAEEAGTRSAQRGARGARPHVLQYAGILYIWE